MALAIACLAGALTLINVAPVQVELTSVASDASKAIPAAIAADPAEIRTADPAKKPG
ncbi:MAG: hypothetical protein Q8Q88_01400 [Phenylobacterium sp.]|uniref:hypothetical protein n=1 Tax=Phenylobacterium sp. TaxID=1871053 RepID=UPI002737599F|nr:hypothetical protein [Phenylobacterium sp.]MDP3745681.1 hypothetical protein [Phenylobacterium sp.]